MSDPVASRLAVVARVPLTSYDVAYESSDGVNVLTVGAAVVVVVGLTVVGGSVLGGNVAGGSVVVVGANVVVVWGTVVVVSPML